MTAKDGFDDPEAVARIRAEMHDMCDQIIEAQLAFQQARLAGDRDGKLAAGECAVNALKEIIAATDRDGFLTTCYATRGTLQGANTEPDDEKVKAEVLCRLLQDLRDGLSDGFLRDAIHEAHMWLAGRLFGAEVAPIFPFEAPHNRPLREIGAYGARLRIEELVRFEAGRTGRAMGATYATWADQFGDAPREWTDLTKSTKTGVAKYVAGQLAGAQFTAAETKDAEARRKSVVERATRVGESVRGKIALDPSDLAAVENYSAQIADVRRLRGLFAKAFGSGASENLGQ